MRSTAPTRGRCSAVVSAETADRALEAMRATETGRDSAVIGRVSGADGRVVLRTESGGGRILQKLAGAQLPRIC